MGVIDLQVVTQRGFEVLSGTEVAAFKKATSQDTKPQLHLVEPGAMFRGKVKHMRMARIAEESPSLCASTQLLGHKGYLAPLGYHTAQVEAPVSIEIIHHPVVTVHGRQLRGYRRLRRHPCDEEQEPAGPLCYPSPQIVGRGDRYVIGASCPFERLVPGARDPIIGDRPRPDPVWETAFALLLPR